MITDPQHSGCSLNLTTDTCKQSCAQDQLRGTEFSRKGICKERKFQGKAQNLHPCEFARNVVSISSVGGSIWPAIPVRVNVPCFEHSQ